MSLERIWGKPSGRNLMFFLSLLDIQPKYFVLLPKIFRRCCQNFPPRLHRNSFKGKKLFWKKISFLSFSDIERKNFGSWRKISDVVVDNLSYVSIATILNKIFFEKILIFYIFFEHWAEKFWPFTESFPAAFSRQHSTCPLEHV